MTRLRGERWHEKKLNTPFAALADYDIDSFGGEDPPHAPAVPASISETETHSKAEPLLITYVNGNGSQFEEYDEQARATERVAKLIMGGAGNVRLWRPIEYRQMVSIVVD